MEALSGGSIPVVQRSPYQCDNDFSRLQEEKIFGQLNPGNGIETIPDQLLPSLLLHNV
jgi:hypothetical protein